MTCILGGRWIYQYWASDKSGVYKGNLLVHKKGTRGIYGIINPNQMNDYMFLDFSDFMQNEHIEKTSIPIIEDNVIYIIGYSSQETTRYFFFKIADNVVQRVPIPDFVQHETINNISNIPQFLVVGIGENLYFITKKDLKIIKVYSQLNFNSNILPYKDGVIIISRVRNAVVYCDKNHHEILFYLPLEYTLDNWYSDDLLMVNKFGGGLILVNLKGETVQNFDNSFFHIMGYEPDKQATLSVMEPHRYELFSFNFQFMDILRTDRPRFSHPYIYDIKSRNIINLPDWAGYGMWINQNFDKEKFEKIINVK